MRPLSERNSMMITVPSASDLCSRFLQIVRSAWTWLDLDERVHWSLRLFQHLESFFVFVGGEQRGFHGGQEAAERTEGCVDGAGLIAAVDHAIGAGGIAGL